MRNTRGRPLRQSDESYRNTLRELRRRVEDGTPLSYYDSTMIGDKNTECTLGLCDNKLEAMQDGVYREDRHVCPHDMRYFDVYGARTGAAIEPVVGCFWTCAVFQRKGGSPQYRILAVTDVLATDDRHRAFVADLK